MANRALFISWLQDAYAMEQAQLELLTRYTSDFNGYEDIKANLEAHLTETKQQAEDIKACLLTLDADTSTGRNLLGKLTGILQGTVTGIHKDEIVKNLLVLYGGEHFEYACYTSLAIAAKELGEEKVQIICERIAAEEKHAADAVLAQIPTVTTDILMNVA